MGAHIKFSTNIVILRIGLKSMEIGITLFLPRIGEIVNAWIWIETSRFSRTDIEKILNSDGQKSLL